MGLRPGRVVREVRRPYTRVSKSKPRKSYVVGVPFPKLHQYEMGTKNPAYDTTLYLVARTAVQIRDNAMEAARIVSTRFLETKLTTNFFLKILVYPHQVVREHSIAQGAGADRFSQGMRLNFGHPVGTAAIVKKGQRIMMVKTMKEHLDVAKIGLKKAGLKICTATRIVVE